MLSEPMIGITTRCHAGLPTGYNLKPSRSVSKISATTTSPVKAPIMMLKTSSSCCSRSAKRAPSQRIGDRHQGRTGASTVSLIDSQPLHEHHSEVFQRIDTTSRERGYWL